MELAENIRMTEMIRTSFLPPSFSPHLALEREQRLKTHLEEDWLHHPYPPLLNKDPQIIIPMPKKDMKIRLNL
jgi:hypothetical protein